MIGSTHSDTFTVASDLVTVSLAPHSGDVSDESKLTYTLNIDGTVEAADAGHVFAKVEVAVAGGSTTTQYIEVKTGGNTFEVDTVEMHGKAFTVTVVDLVNADQAHISDKDFVIGSTHSDTFTVEDDRITVNLNHTNDEGKYILSLTHGSDADLPNGTDWSNIYAKIRVGDDDHSYQYVKVGQTLETDDGKHISFADNNLYVRDVNSVSSEKDDSGVKYTYKALSLGEASEDLSFKVTDKTGAKEEDIKHWSDLHVSSGSDDHEFSSHIESLDVSKGDHLNFTNLEGLGKGDSINDTIYIGENYQSHSDITIGHGDNRYNVATIDNHSGSDGKYSEVTSRDLIANQNTNGASWTDSIEVKSSYDPTQVDHAGNATTPDHGHWVYSVENGSAHLDAEHNTLNITSDPGKTASVEIQTGDGHVFKVDHVDKIHWS